MKIIKPALLGILYFVIATAYAQKSSDQKFPYKDSSLSVEVRVTDLLERMTLDEKISQMNMLSLSHLKLNKNGEVSQHSLDSLFKGGSIGTLESPFIGVDEIAKRSEAADHYLRTNTRLGIPAIQIAECLHGQLAFGATIFPQTIAQGSTWNPELIEKMGAAMQKKPASQA